jgi:predicted DNA-binding protein (MmcQ/YjbR family)
MIRGKMFAMKGGDGKGRPIISLKLEPPHGEILRGEYPDIFPGYYMNKLHWNSVHLEGDVPDDVLRAMIDESHSLILSSFSRKAQAEIMA